MVEIDSYKKDVKDKNPKDGMSQKGKDTIRGTGGKQLPPIKKG